ncbi:MAG TPA: hypothetical protein VNW29_05555 [Candidatus Sulfotelmatobacter sp.]|jgi:hypothetical protein|nr:hypothetical protein [Candidatus Sulfotelmatobacter sp.]
MKRLTLLSLLALFFIGAHPVYAQTNTDVSTFTSQTMSTLIVFASLGTVFFLIKGGYAYITSTGKPDALEHAKKTIRNALIGLILVVTAGFTSQLLTNALTLPSNLSHTTPLQVTPIIPIPPPGGLTQVIIDAIYGLIQTIIISATKPLVDGIISLLATTPSVVTNSVIFNFWLTILGITDALFVLLIAVLGFQFMSAASFGYEEIEFKHVLPKIAVTFLGANSSLFLVDWVITLCNTLVNALLKTTGGLDKAWVLNAFNPAALGTDGRGTALITLIFMLLFVILAAILLLFYIIRLIVVALGAVLSPLIFLLWAVPKFSDFAEISAKSYLTMIFTVFVHVVIIQLASAFLTLPGQVGTNSLVSVLVAIGLFLTLLKTPSFMFQLMFYNTGRGMVRKLGGQIMNVITNKRENVSAPPEGSGKVQISRKVVTA